MTLKFTVGDLTIHRIIEQETTFLPALEMLPGLTPDLLAENRQWMQKAGALDDKDVLILCFQSYVVKTPHHTILIDSCIGNDKPRPQRPKWNMKTDDTYARALAAAGISVGDIDYVMCTHLHVDHVGWNTRLDNGRWVPTFPNARYLIARREWAHWQAAGPAALVRTSDYITDSVLPVFEAGQADLIGDEHALAAGISVEPAPGHTPGQLMVRVGSGREQAILSADLMHHPLQVRYPDWSTRFCTDPGEARTTRLGFFNAHAGTGRLIFPAHFPSPTGGTIERDGKDYRFTFCGEDHGCFGGG